MNIIQDPLPSFTDERGTIQNLVVGANIDSVSVITSVKGAIRANHWHRISGHACIMTKGSVDYFERPVGSQDKPTKVSIGIGQVFWTGPNVEHAMLFTGEENEMWCFRTGASSQAEYENELVRLNFDLTQI